MQTLVMGRLTRFQKRDRKQDYQLFPGGSGAGVMVKVGSQVYWPARWKQATPKEGDAGSTPAWGAGPVFVFPQDESGDGGNGHREGGRCVDGAGSGAGKHSRWRRRW